MHRSAPAPPPGEAARPDDIEPSDVGPSDVGPSDVGPSDVGPSDVGAVVTRARAAAVRRLAALTGGFDELVAASRDSNADDEHDPEGATIAFERSQLDALVVRARAQVAELDAAVERLTQGRYGRCEVCGEAIAPARLDALPAARTCIACARGGAR